MSVRLSLDLSVRPSVWMSTFREWSFEAISVRGAYPSIYLCIDLLQSVIGWEYHCFLGDIFKFLKYKLSLTLNFLWAKILRTTWPETLSAKPENVQHLKHFFKKKREKIISCRLYLQHLECPSVDIMMNDHGANNSVNCCSRKTHLNVYFFPLKYRLYLLPLWFSDYAFFTIACSTASSISTWLGGVTDPWIDDLTT